MVLQASSGEVRRVVDRLDRERLGRQGVTRRGKVR